MRFHNIQRRTDARSTGAVEATVAACGGGATEPLLCPMPLRPFTFYTHGLMYIFKTFSPPPTPGPSSSPPGFLLITRPPPGHASPSGAHSRAPPPPGRKHEVVVRVRRRTKRHRFAFTSSSYRRPSSLTRLRGLIFWAGGGAKF